VGQRSGTCARQLATVQRWHDADQRDRDLVRAVAYGTWSQAPSVIEQAAGARSSDADWTERLTETLATFRHCRWPSSYLRPAGA
jgi:hypothetical protein